MRQKWSPPTCHCRVLKGAGSRAPEGAQRLAQGQMTSGEHGCLFCCLVWHVFRAVPHMAKATECHAWTAVLGSVGSMSMRTCCALGISRIVACEAATVLVLCCLAGHLSLSSHGLAACRNKAVAAHLGMGPKPRRRGKGHKRGR